MKTAALKTYKKTATVQAKIFEKGDEDGMTWTDEELSHGMEDAHYGFKEPEATIPYISTIENQKHKGIFGRFYICTGIKGERWLVEKGIFEATYEILPEVKETNWEEIERLLFDNENLNADLSKRDCYEITQFFKSHPIREEAKWISVKDRLPELDDCTYLVILNHPIRCKIPTIGLSNFFNKKWTNSNKSVTHWHPLPEKPIAK